MSASTPTSVGSRRIARLTLAGVIAGALLASPVANAWQAPSLEPFYLPAGFEVSTVADAFYQPVSMAFLPRAGDQDRILITERAGIVKMIEGSTVRAEPVLDIRDQVFSANLDRGLIGIAVDPHFTQTGHIYLSFIYNAPGQTGDEEGLRYGHISRFTLKGDTADRASERVLLDDLMSNSRNHGIGGLAFGLDGALYSTFGDGAISDALTEYALRSQDVDSLNGKTVRIDPQTGDGLPGNPYYDPANPRSARSRVWARGFRNPFKFAIHPVTGVPLVGDVGWWTYEWLVRAPAGANFGWPCMEGPISTPFSARTACADVLPWNVSPQDYAYPHTREGQRFAASLTAGDYNIYGHFPDAMKGNFFFGDYSQQWIRRAVLAADGRITRVEKFGAGLGEIVDVHFSPYTGELFFLSIFTHGLRKITYKPNVGLGGSAGERTPAPALTARVLAPGDGDVAPGGSIVPLRAALSGADGGCQWQAALLDGLNSRLLPVETAGGSAAFRMPAGLAPAARIEVTCYATSPSGARTAARAGVRPPDEDGYIRNWLLSRAYRGATLNDNVWPGGEAAFTPKPSDPALWRIVSPSRVIALSELLTPAENAAAYAFVWVDVPEERTGLLGMLSDDGIAAWWNGREIWRNKVSRAMPMDGPEALRDIDLPKIELKKGRNALLLKIDQNRGDWRFKARILNADGSIMRDVGLTTGIP